MQIFRDIAKVSLNKPTVLTIGTFDGLHRGHQSLINNLKKATTKHQATTAIIAFHPRPKTVLSPHQLRNDYLTTPQERIALFEKYGLDILVLIPFTVELSQITTYNFIKLIAKHLNPVELWVGHDFAMGRNREGNIKKLTELGQEFGYTVSEIDPFIIDGKTVSSSHIRKLLLEGDVSRSAVLLGRYLSVSGVIVQGMQRGRTIGFPTANFSISPERLVPANGVYATFVKRQGEKRPYPSVTNVGVRPSFVDNTRTIEAHIFDFDEDIYGQQWSLEFVKYLRPERKFDDISELISQIKQDSKQARALLSGKK